MLQYRLWSKVISVPFQRKWMIPG